MHRLRSRIEHAHFTFDTPLTATIGRTGGLNVRLAGAKGNLTVLADGTTIQLEQEGPVSTGYFRELSSFQAVHGQSATVTAFTELIHAMNTGGPAAVLQRDILQSTAMLMGFAWSNLQDRQPVDIASVPDSLVVTGRYGNAFA